MATVQTRNSLTDTSQTNNVKNNKSNNQEDFDKTKDMKYKSNLTKSQSRVNFSQFSQDKNAVWCQKN